MNDDARCKVNEELHREAIRRAQRDDSEAARHYLSSSMHHVKHWLAQKHTEVDSARIFMKSLSGRTTTILVPSDFAAWTCFDLKVAMSLADGTPVQQQRLIVNGAELPDGATLRDAGLQPDSAVHLILKLRGD